jgi:hypothetical protein
MRIRIWMLALAPFGLIGCADETPPPPVTTTTTVTREVTTNGPVVEPVGRDVIVTQAPPPVRVETQTVAPGPTYIWQKGYWRWSGSRYVWVPGHWVERPRVAAVWVEGHWIRRGGGWVWVGGHWQ